MLTRRTFVGAGFAAALPGVAVAGDVTRLPIADMHAHLFFVGPRPADTQPLARSMAAGGATLVAWSLVSDQPWLEPANGTFRQRGKPRPGEAITWLRQELGRIRAHMTNQGLVAVRAAGDVDAALAGEPRVVLATEGATFADEGSQGIEIAHALGIRQIQLVHFVETPLGDRQTAPRDDDGLTAKGRAALETCQRLGILVDLAHLGERAVHEALAVSRRPMLCSHGSVATQLPRRKTGGAWRARQLSAETARAIAKAGGVIGLWALGADVGTTVERYADRMHALISLVGEDHIGFGSDLNALRKPALARFADHRRVVDILLARSVPEAIVRKAAIGNYSRILKQTLVPA